MERRHSTTSDSSTGSRPSLGGESVDGNGTGGTPTVPPCGRVGKTLAPKPPPNALQFVKVGPCDLYRQAQEQLKKVEEIRKSKKVQKEEVEDWQSNLDNWKCSRRKRQEHIIERVVEVKKFELEEHERNRRKSKTFNEMMQERNSRGRASNLPAYLNDEDDDLSDLGLTSNKSSSTNHSNVDNASSTDGETPAGKSDEEQSRVREGEEKQEYTYEWAIQSYVNFAENRVKSKSTACIATLGGNAVSAGDLGGARPAVPPKKNYPPVAMKPTAKVENYLKSVSVESSVETKKPAVPKVDVNRRRELFEMMQGVDETGSNSRLSPPETSKSIKERLSSLERQAKDNSLSPPKESKVNGVPIEPEVVKSRLRNIEALSTGNLSAPLPPKKIKEEELLNGSLSVKERLSNLTKAVNCEPNGERRPSRNNSDASMGAPKLTPTRPETPTADEADPSESALPLSRQHYRHRSLDSLDIDGSVGCGSAAIASEENAVSPGPFERVQSLEDLDFSSRNYPPSTFSGDTDREDSGIHTADVSSSVSQADDYELHSDPIPVVDHNETVIHRPHCDVSGETTLFEEGEDEAKEEAHRSDDPVVLVEGEQSAMIVSSVDSPPQSNPASTNFSPISSSCHERNEMTLQFQPTLSSVSPHISVDGETVEEPPRDFTSEDEGKLYTHDNNSCDKSLSNNTLTSVNTQLPVIAATEESTPTFKEPSPQLIKGIVMDVYSDTQQDVLFNLSPPATLEPPKEKPPPPPTDNSDEEERLSSLNESSLRRLDSTKRIKKEIRQKRSSFLGLEGNTDDSYLEPEIELVRPPDMTAILAEERRLERQLYRQSVCSESDSNQESRDSGVELDHKATDADTWGHSRNDSELYGNQNSNYSDDDEIIKKEREIIETLEQEEKIRKQDLEKLALRLRELEAEKDSLEWQQHTQPPQPEARPRHRSAPPEPPCSDHYRQADQVILPKEAPVNGQNTPINPQGDPFWGNASSGQNHKYEQLQYRKSLQDLSRIQSQLQPPTALPIVITHSHVSPSKVPYPKNNTTHRRSMPNLQEAGLPRNTTVPPAVIVTPRRPPPPPPILPERSRHNHNNDANVNGNGPMSRQTLQALSAVPRSRIITGDTWQAKKKQSRPTDNYNYQHWLIQEAEHRRITEHHQRQMNGVPNCKAVPHEQFASPMGAQNWYNGKGMGPVGYPHQTQKPTPPAKGKPLPDSIIQTLTQRVQKMNSENNNRRRQEMLASQEIQKPDNTGKDKMLSVSGKKRCSHCSEELGRGAAMIIESLQLFYHIDCFKCCVCCLQLGDGLIGTDVRVRNNKLHCHNCYSSDDGVKFSCV